MNKKITLSILAVVIVVALGVLIFYSIKKPSSKEGTAQTQTQAQNQKTENTKPAEKTTPVGQTPTQTQQEIEKQNKEQGFSSCVILDEKYCKEGEPLFDKDKKFIGLGFALLKGAKIYAPFDGYIDNNIGVEVFPNQLHRGFSVSNRQTDKQMNIFTVVGSVKTIVKPEHIFSPEQPNLLVNQSVKKGEAIAQIEKSPIKIITPDGEKSYAMAIDFTTYDFTSGSQSEHTLDLFQQYFGNNFDKTK